MHNERGSNPFYDEFGDHQGHPRKINRKTILRVPRGSNFSGESCSDIQPGIQSHQSPSVGSDLLCNGKRIAGTTQIINNGLHVNP